MDQIMWKKLVEYNPDTGQFIWRVRGDSCYSRTRDRKRFNTWRAMKDATTINSNGYAVISHKSVHYLAHRVAWCMVNGSYPDESIDHVNHNRADNRIDNLSLASHLENMQNQKLRPDNKSGFTGVRFDKRIKKWRAYITVDTKCVGLGSYNDFKDAKEARVAANKRYGFHKNHGDIYEY